MMQPMGGPPQFGPPVEMDGQQWMGPVAEQMIPLNCPPGNLYIITWMLLSTRFSRTLINFTRSWLR